MLRVISGNGSKGNQPQRKAAHVSPVLPPRCLLESKRAPLPILDACRICWTFLC